MPDRGATWQLFIFQPPPYLLSNSFVRKLVLVILLIVAGLLIQAPCADTFRLTNGDTISGEALAASANDAGIQIKVGDGEYQRVNWASFSQEDLKKFNQNPKLQAFVEPFIEITQEQRIAKTEVVIKQPTRLPQVQKQSLLGAMFSSGIGVFLLVLLYAANIYGAYEISIFRAQPTALVCGVAAVAPIIGPIIFLSMPTRVKPGDQAAAQEGTAGEPTAAPGSASDEINPMLDPNAAHPEGLHVAHTEHEKKAHLPSTTYQRGQFTFNRRFFETKFPGFFGSVRREADKDMVLIFKSTKGQYTANRITRIASADLHIEVHSGHATQEIMIPFQEIQEIRHQHKDAA